MSRVEHVMLFAAGLYTVYNIMKDIGLEPIFIPFVKRILTGSTKTTEEPALIVYKINKK